MYISIAEYTARAEAVPFAVWVPGLTIVSRRRRRSRLTRAREEGKHPASWATFAMVAAQMRFTSVQRRTLRIRADRQRRCCRYAVSLLGSSTSGPVYHCLNQGRNQISFESIARTAIKFNRDMTFFLAARVFLSATKRQRI